MFLLHVLNTRFILSSKLPVGKGLRSVVSKTNHSLVWIVRKVDNGYITIQWPEISVVFRPADSVFFLLTLSYPMDSDLSGG